jgi:hypothetical protein
MLVVAVKDAPVSTGSARESAELSSFRFAKPLVTYLPAQLNLLQ